MNFWFTYVDDVGGCHWDWHFIVFMWLLLNVGPVWYTIYFNKHVKPDAVRDANYQPFVRLDYENWSYFKGFIFGLLTWPRFIVGWSAFFACALSVAILKSTKSKDKPLTGWRYWLVNKIV